MHRRTPELDRSRADKQLAVRLLAVTTSHVLNSCRDLQVVGFDADFAEFEVVAVFNDEEGVVHDHFDACAVWALLKIIEQVGRQRVGVRVSDVLAFRNILAAACLLEELFEVCLAALHEWPVRIGVTDRHLHLVVHIFINPVEVLFGNNQPRRAHINLDVLVVCFHLLLASQWTRFL